MRSELASRLATSMGAATAREAMAAPMLRALNENFMVEDGGEKDGTSVGWGRGGGEMWV